MLAKSENNTDLSSQRERISRIYKKRGVAAPHSLLEVPEEASELQGPLPISSNTSRYYSAGKRRSDKDVAGVGLLSCGDSCDEHNMMTAATSYASTNEANSQVYSCFTTDQNIMNFQSLLKSSRTEPMTPNRHLDSSSNHVFKLLKCRRSNEKDQKLQADLLAEKLNQLVELSPEEILEQRHKAYARSVIDQHERSSSVCSVRSDEAHQGMLTIRRDLRKTQAICDQVYRAQKSLQDTCDLRLGEINLAQVDYFRVSGPHRSNRNLKIRLPAFGTAFTKKITLPLSDIKTKTNPMPSPTRNNLVACELGNASNISTHRRSKPADFSDMSEALKLRKMIVSKNRPAINIDQIV